MEFLHKVSLFPSSPMEASGLFFFQDKVRFVYYCGGWGRGRERRESDMKYVGGKGGLKPEEELY